eukprot:6351323-Amphidinium_carterae.1
MDLQTSRLQLSMSRTGVFSPIKKTLGAEDGSTTSGLELDMSRIISPIKKSITYQGSVAN